MSEQTRNECGYVVFQDGGMTLLLYGAAERWFPTYDEAIAYAMNIVKARTEEFKKNIDRNSVIVYEGAESLMHTSHSCPCGRVVFCWRNYEN